MDNKNENTIKISDLCLAVVVSLYFPIVRIDKSNPKRAEFVFNHTKDLEEFINAYWSGSTSIEPKAFFNQLKTIKSMLYFESS